MASRLSDRTVGWRRFWGHPYVINYLRGIATGIVQLRLPTETGARFARLGAGLVPPALVAAGAAADPATLRLLNWLALPLIPAIVAFQAMCWWAFRGRVDANAPAFY